MLKKTGPYNPFLITLCLLLLSCVKPEVESPLEMYWPLPPEKPRIKLVDIIISSLDVGHSGDGIKELLLGQEPEVRFIKPFGVTAGDGKMFVTDIGGVHLYDFRNKTFRVIGQEDLRLPAGIAIYKGRLYVGDVVKRRVYVYNEKFEPVMEFGFKILNSPAGIAVDRKNERLIISDTRNHKLFIYGLDGRLIKTIGGRGKRPGRFNFPYGVAVDREGRIYVVDSGNFRLQILDEEGNFIKSIGSVGTVPGRFARPKGVALDSEGHIYVLDTAFGNFQIFDLEGRTLLAVGRNGRGPGEFMLPSSIYIDENDQIYVVDQLNRRVQIFQYLKYTE